MASDYGGDKIGPLGRPQGRFPGLPAGFQASRPVSRLPGRFRSFRACFGLPEQPIPGPENIDFGRSVATGSGMPLEAAKNRQRNRKALRFSCWGRVGRGFTRCACAALFCRCATEAMCYLNGRSQLWQRPAGIPAAQNAPMCYDYP